MHSRSLPNLRVSEYLTNQSRLSSAEAQAWVDQKLNRVNEERRKGAGALSPVSSQRAGLPQRPRRWTVPTKARPTKAVCGSPSTAELANAAANISFTSVPAGEILRQSALSRAPSADTPAMITLRRATRQMSRRISTDPSRLTFFPPPVLTQTRSTNLFSLLGLNPDSGTSDVGQPEPIDPFSPFSHSHVTPLLPKRASVTGNYAQPGCSSIALPAYTEVLVSPTWQQVVSEQPPQATSIRRYSTKITSGNSVHEIIWDENISSSGSDATSTGISRQGTTKDQKPPSLGGNRRKSVAAEILEMQLKRSDEESRRTSTGSDLRTFPSDPSEFQPNHHKSFQKLLNWQFSGINSDQGHLTKLPRSRASAASRVDHELAFTETEDTTTIEELDSIGPRCGQVNFFPPVRSRASTGASKRPYRQEAENVQSATSATWSSQATSPMASAAHFISATASREPSSPPRRSMGSALGQVSHVRRQSADVTNRSASTAAARRHSEWIKGRLHIAEEGEYAPLLSGMGHDGNLSRKNSAPPSFGSNPAHTEIVSQTKRARNMNVPCIFRYLPTCLSTCLLGRLLRRVGEDEVRKRVDAEVDASLATAEAPVIGTVSTSTIGVRHLDLVR